MNSSSWRLDEQDHPVEGRMNSRQRRGARGWVVEQDPVVWRAVRTVDGGGVVE